MRAITAPHFYIFPEYRPYRLRNILRDILHIKELQVPDLFFLSLNSSMVLPADIYNLHIRDFVPIWINIMGLRPGIDHEELKLFGNKPHFLSEFTLGGFLHSLIDLQATPGIGPLVVISPSAQKHLPLLIFDYHAGGTLHQHPVPDDLSQILNVITHIFHLS